MPVKQSAPSLPPSLLPIAHLVLVTIAGLEETFGKLVELAEARHDPHTLERSKDQRREGGREGGRRKKKKGSRINLKWVYFLSLVMSTAS